MGAPRWAQKKAFVGRARERAAGTHGPRGQRHLAPLTATLTSTRVVLYGSVNVRVRVPRVLPSRLKVVTLK